MVTLLRYPSLTNEQEAHRVASELCEVVSQRLQRPLLQKLLEQLKRLLRELGRTGFLYGIRRLVGDMLENFLRRAF